MNDIKPIAETAETVTLSRSDWNALLDRLEDIEDMAAVTARREHEARLGKEVARQDYLSASEVRRLLDGASPVAIWRGKRGLSQRALAKSAGVGASYVAEIERGHKRGSAEALARLAGALRLPVEELIQIRAVNVGERTLSGQLFIRLQNLIETVPTTTAVETAKLIDAALNETAKHLGKGSGKVIAAELRDRFIAYAEECGQNNDTFRRDMALEILARIRSIATD